MIKHLVLIVGALTSLLPFVWMAFASFKPYAEAIGSRALLPKVWTFGNYTQVLQRVGFLVAFRNSTLVAIPTTVLVVLTSAAAGYVFAKYQFKGKEALFRLLLSTMMVPFTVIVIPLFVTVSSFGLVDTLWGITITGICSTFGIFLMRQTIKAIPNDYIDAARIDGASELWIFRQVIIPLSSAAISTLTVFIFLGKWDSFLWPSIVLKSASKHTIPVLVAGMRDLYQEQYELWAACSMLTVIPVMILFTLAQKQFIGGLSLTGLKG